MNKQKLTCPNCNSKFYDIICLASNPLQYEYQCRKCQWGLRYFERSNSFKKITQNELDRIYENNNNKKGNNI